MKAELLMIGTELLLGQTQDTNSTYLGKTLADNGINLYQKTTVGDNHDRIMDALHGALDRSDIVFCSGGLGPTADDITRDCVAEVAGVELEYHQSIVDNIQQKFTAFGSRMTENNKRQAMVPQGGTVIDNPNGTAPGLLVECDRGLIFCLPGPPRELKPMMRDSVLPILRARFELNSIIHYRVLHICGMGESKVDQVIKELIGESSNPTVGILASPGAVRIRIAAKAESILAAEALIAPVEEVVRSYFPGIIFGVDDETLEGVVDQLMGNRGWGMDVIETISAGSIASRLTKIDADCYRSGRVYPLKSLDLGDIEGLSLELASRSMVESGSDCALAVVADPAAGSSIATFIYPDGQESWSLGRTGQSNVMQERTAILALEYLRRFLIQ